MSLSLFYCCGLRPECLCKGIHLANVHVGWRVSRGIGKNHFYSCLFCRSSVRWISFFFFFCLFFCEHIPHFTASHRNLPGPSKIKKGRNKRGSNFSRVQQFCICCADATLSGDESVRMRQQCKPFLSFTLKIVLVLRERRLWHHYPTRESMFFLVFVCLFVCLHVCRLICSIGANV